MLKYLNQEKTAASFKGACFRLAAPEDWDSIGDGPTRAAVRAWLDAGNTPEPADAKTAGELWQMVKTKRDNLTRTGGLKIEVSPGDFRWFHTDEYSKLQQLTLATKGVPAGTQWKTMDGTFVEITSSIMTQVTAEQITRDIAIFAHAELLKAQLDASPDPELVDIDSGWPESFPGEPA